MDCGLSPQNEASTSFGVAMRMDKLTSRFQQSLADAQSLALGRDHQFLEPAHVMLALLDGAGGSLRPLLLKAGVDVNKLRAGLLALLEGLPKVEGAPGDIHVSNDLNRVLTTDDLVTSDDVFFAATGITDGELVDGVRYLRGHATTHSLVMRSRSGTIRSIKSEHQLWKLRAYSSVNFG